jgi:hypothetical protein
MQTHCQTRLEVGIDVGFSLLVNLGAQLLVYGALATAGRSLMFVSLLLGLAIPRRYATRRMFEAYFTTGPSQTRWQSWLEVGTDTVCGLGIAMVLQWMVYGPAATWAKAGGLTVVIYIITLGRRYLLRRLFARWSTARAAQARHREVESSQLKVSGTGHRAAQARHIEAERPQGEPVRG